MDSQRDCSFSVIADGFYRAAFLGFFATGFFLGVFRLFVHEGISAVVVSFEIVRSGLAAQIAIYAIVVHVELSTRVFRVSVRDVSHKVYARAVWGSH
jgi:hypothetical protein